MNYLLMAVIFVLNSTMAMATEPFKSFQQDSLSEITNEFENQPFILLLWSIDCPPCLKELANIQRLEQQSAPLDIVYVSTDGIEHSADIAKTLKEFQLEERNHWVFDGVMPERLRYVIDPNWYGELPRSYFYNRSHKRTAHSGILSSDDLQHWINNYDFLKRIPRLNGFRHLSFNEFY